VGRQSVTCGGRCCAVWRRAANAMLIDATRHVDAVKVGQTEVDPAFRIRTLIVVNIDSYTACLVICAVVKTAGHGQWLSDQLTS